MKSIKSILAIALIAIMATCMAACSNNTTTDPTPTAAGDATPTAALETTEPTTEPTVEPTVEPTTDPTTAPETYSNDAYSFTVPTSWVGNYETEEVDGGVKFIHTANKASGGVLCTIMAYEGANATPSSTDDKVLGTAGEVTYILVVPTDVQYSADDAELQAEYEALYADIATIVETFELATAE